MCACPCAHGCLWVSVVVFVFVSVTVSVSVCRCVTGSVCTGADGAEYDTHAEKMAAMFGGSRCVHASDDSIVMYNTEYLRCAT